MKLKDWIMTEQYFDKKTAKKFENPRKRKEKPINLVDLYLKKQAEADELKKALEDFGKLTKKEEKKKEESKFSFAQTAMIIFAISPITGAAYYYLMVSILAAIKTVH